MEMGTREYRMMLRNTSDLSRVSGSRGGPALFDEMIPNRIVQTPLYLDLIRDVNPNSSCYYYYLLRDSSLDSQNAVMTVAMMKS